MTFNTNFKTAWILIVTAIGLVVWDLYARHFPGATISEEVLTMAMRHPVVPFLAGVLGGHCFWFQEVPANDEAGKSKAPN